MSSRVRIHENLADVAWPNTEDGDYARRFLTPLMRDGVRKYVRNVDTRMAVLRVDDLALPLTINDAEYENSYVASPYTHYVTYAEEESYLLDDAAVRVLLRGIIKGLGGYMRLAKSNKVVHVNNWLVSTNLYPDITRTQLLAMRDALIRKYPDHTLIFRSVNRFRSNELYDGFRAAGFAAVLSRQIYLLDTAVERNFRSKPFKSDLKLLRETQYTTHEADELTAADAPRVEALYNQLYLDKYSHLNPQYTAEFFDLARREKLLTMKFLRSPTGSIDAVFGYFQRNGVMTTPLFGYNTSISQSVGLYRMLGAVLALEAKEKQLLLNDSSGAATFKRLRRETPAAEFSMVFADHLPRRRRAHWKALALLSARFGETLLNRYEF